ncbi:MAG: V-type ATP synthase subunit I [Spirochaetaceae bacterium]|jgi:V/A-type H+-transporting ATPase subunit I|nr:V-type ATP synthase subunit I [Spirochaetaceae bacterium]
MKQIELTVLSRDVDQVIEFLGRRALLHLSEDEEVGGIVHALDTADYRHILENLERIRNGAAYLGIELPEEPEESSRLPGEAEEALTDKIITAIGILTSRENTEKGEKRKVEEALNEAKAFANLNAPFSDLDQLSYLTLRVGRLDPKRQNELRENLSDRAVIIPLGQGPSGEGGDRVLAAASRKGRFALDSELKRLSFVPITIPEGYKGVPGELLSGLEARLAGVEKELEKINGEKTQIRREYGGTIRSLAAAYLMASLVEQLKGKLRSTRSVYILSGWVPSDAVPSLVDGLEKCTQGRVAIRTFNPDEVEEVKEGKTKVPVSLDHGSFVKGFEGVVFSYGAPLYGTIDPTPFVAFFFTILFGIMFGDLGQGLVLLFLGMLTGRRGLKILQGGRRYSVPLIAVGISSMVMGFLNGAVFTNEELLIAPTKAVTGFFMNLFGLTGGPPERILQLMPEKGSIEKLFYFFGFTIAVGVVLNSVGLLVNIVNQCTLKKYEKAFFSKTGVAGILLFWYALFIAVKILVGGRFIWLDLGGLMLPAFCIFFGPVIWRIISGKRPVLEQGLMVFIMEGFVEILETASTYISNTVSFLRVGAFALSHAVLSFIVFTLSGMVAHLAGGPVFSVIIMIFGNAVIILLEGMIVAIQVVRLQYYEFFSKFFTETGVEFSPFRFRREAVAGKVRNSE